MPRPPFPRAVGQTAAQRRELNKCTPQAYPRVLQGSGMNHAFLCPSHGIAWVGFTISSLVSFGHDGAGTPGRASQHANLMRSSARSFGGRPFRWVLGLRFIEIVPVSATP